MIIAGKDKKLITSVVSSSDGRPVISGSIFKIIRLESTDADDGKFWTTGSQWEALPFASASFPTGSHVKGDMWSFDLSGSASTGKSDAIIYWSATDDLGIDNETSASIVSAGGEHKIWSAEPSELALESTLVLVSGNVDSLPSAAAISASVWNAVSANHLTAGSTGKILVDSSGNLDSIADAVWEEPMLLHTSSAGTAGRLLNEATGSFTASDLQLYESEPS